MKELSEIFNLVKSQFCNLTDYRIRGSSIEIITPFSSINNKLASVFIKKISNNYVVGDGGWLDLNYYNIEIDDEDDLKNNITNQFIEHYDIQFKLDDFGTTHYFKKTEEITHIPSLVFDLSNFICGIVNTYTLSFDDKKERAERDSFKSDANEFIKDKYADSVSFRQSLDDIEQVKFNAVITKSKNIYLITYITGSTPYYFQNDLNKTIVNYELSEKSKYESLIRERISIINDYADGYQPDKSKAVLELLQEKLTRPPLLWSNKDTLVSFIP